MIFSHEKVETVAFNPSEKVECRNPQFLAWLCRKSEKVEKVEVEGVPHEDGGWVSQKTLLQGTRIETNVLKRIMEEAVARREVEVRSVKTPTKPRMEFRLMVEHQSGEGVDRHHQEAGA